MPTIQRIRRTASRLLLTLTALTALFLSSFAPLVSADATTAYTAGQIQAWLEGMISDTTVVVTEHPVVELTPTSRLLKITNLSFQVRGVTIGLSELRVTCNGTTTVAVAGELDMLGKFPRFSCTLDLEYVGADGELKVADIRDIVIAQTYTPSLSSEDINTIVDVLNQVLDASELSVTSQGGDLTGIDVVMHNGEAKLKTTWTDATSYQDATQLEEKLGGMVDTLAQKAMAYLQDNERDWSVDVDVVSDTSLDIDASFTAFGIRAAITDMAITFDELTASVTDALFSIGTATKEATFSLDAEIGCTNQTPSLTITSLTATGEHSGFNGFISDIAPALLDAMNDAAAAIIADIELLCPYSSISAITVEGETVVLHEGARLVEGDANLDGKTNIIDAMFVAQYVVGLRTFNADQMKAADTTDDGKVNIIDAMHIAQFVVDPRQTAGVLFKPLWESSADYDMINPLDL